MICYYFKKKMKRLTVRADIWYTVNNAVEVRRMSIGYQVDHWEEAMAMLFATNAWQAHIADVIHVKNLNFSFD